MKLSFLQLATVGLEGQLGATFEEGALEEEGAFAGKRDGFHGFPSGQIPASEGVAVEVP